METRVSGRSKAHGLSLLAILVLCTAVSCTETPAREDGEDGIDRVPLTIEMREDVDVLPDSAQSQRRGRLYGDTSLVIRKGERVVMEWVGPEGGCRVVYNGHRLELSSCPWLPGFADHQPDIFEIVDRQ
jgi:hypothetical protein